MGWELLMQVKCGESARSCKLREQKVLRKLAWQVMDQEIFHLHVYYMSTKNFGSYAQNTERESVKTI